MGTQNATSISIDGLASDIEIGYKPQLAFPGKTLDEINRCTLITELYGGNEDNTVTVRATAWGIYPQRHRLGGSSCGPGPLAKYIFDPLETVEWTLKLEPLCPI